MVTQLQSHDTFIRQLFDSFPFPQYTITPSRRSIFFTTVPVVSARIVFIRWPKADDSLVVMVEHPFAMHLVIELIHFQQFQIVFLVKLIATLRFNDSIVEVTNPEYVTAKSNGQMWRNTQCYAESLEFLLMFIDWPLHDSVFELHAADDFVVIFFPPVNFVCMGRQMWIYETDERFVQL